MASEQSGVSQLPFLDIAPCEAVFHVKRYPAGGAGFSPTWAPDRAFRFRDAAATVRWGVVPPVGKLMAKQAKVIGKAKGAAEKGTKREAVRGKLRGVSDTPRSKPTLAEAGIDKQPADRARKLAALVERQLAASIALSAVRALASLAPTSASSLGALR